MSRHILAIPLGLVMGCGSILGIDNDYEEGAVVPSEAGVDGGDASNGSDATSDATATDGGCAGHICGGVCLPGTDCSTCASAKLFCAGTHACVTGCSSCPSTIECWTCSGSAKGSCEPTPSAFCLSGGYDHCSCASGVNQCPGSNQVCLTGTCETCGASGTDGKSCGGGLECAASQRRCHD